GMFSFLPTACLQMRGPTSFGAPCLTAGRPHKRAPWETLGVLGAPLPNYPR
ncbi:hypothetical protein JTE90_002513, partial [Oedothorax gibbosus]